MTRKDMQTSSIGEWRLLYLFLFLCLCNLVHGQRVVLVCDMETRTPLRDVAVVTPEKYRDTNDYQGICHLPASFGEATFIRYGYIAYTARQESLGDTILLLPSLNALSEVTVWGKDLRKEAIKSFSDAVKDAAASIPRQQQLASFNFADMLDRRGRRDKAHLKKAKELLKEWDAK